MDAPSHRRRAPWQWLGPALAAFAVGLYLVALPNGWTRDDRIFIIGNPLVRDLGKLPAIFTTDYWGFFGKDPLYRPLTVASMSVQYALAGNAPWSYRIVDALLHGCTVWLLLTLLRGGLRLPPAAAGVGALIFAAHPACSEAVLQVVGRADIFVALAALAALRLHLADYRLGTVGPALLVPALLVLLTLGLLSKETAVAIPPLLLATDLARGQARRFMALHAATFALLLGFWFGVRAPILAGIVGTPPGFANPLYDLSFWQRLPGVIGALGRYVGLLLWPLHLSADYSFDAVPARPGVSDPYVILGATSLALSVAGFFWARGRYTALALGLALIWLPLIPVSNAVMRIGTILAERFLYLPVAGLAVLVAQLAASRPRVPRLLLIVPLVLVARTVVRERDWRDELTLTAATAAGSRSATAHYEHAIALQLAGDDVTAEAEYRRVLAISPDHAHGLLQLWQLLRVQSRREEAERLFRQALAAGVRDAGPFVTLGEHIAASGAHPTAAVIFAHATVIDPDSHPAWHGRGLALFQIGDPRRARLALQKALKRKPGDPTTRLALAHVELNGGGNPAEAERLLATVVRDTPSVALAWYDLGEAYVLLDRDDDALRAFERAVTLAPGDPTYRDRLDEVRRPPP